MPAPDDPWLTTAEVAARLRTPESTVRYWRMQGYGPKGIRIGRRVVYRTSEIEKFERQLERAQNTPRAS
jgi:predicted DNA-binding transcriptional regulator AlpA